MLVLVNLASCKKGFFDQIPDDRMTIDEVFQRQLESERYLANIYNYIRDESDQTLNGESPNFGVPWLGLSDEGDITYASQPTYIMNLGNWDATNNRYEFWTHYYNGIRAATYFMQNIGKNEELLRTTEGQSLIKQYHAEARALRAEFYAAMLKQFGPVIILPENEVISAQAPLEELSFPRNSYDECVDFIVAEFDKAASELPVWYTSDLDYGRMNKAVIMALKARTLLYAASPLWNGNQDLTMLKNKDGKALVNTQYNAEKWTKAANAAKEVIDLNIFSLFKQYTTGTTINALASYQNLFLEAWNSEVIFARKSNLLGERWEWRSTPRFAGGTAGNGVTQQQVDAYQMANGEMPILGYNNGVPIINPASGYNETGFSTAATAYTDAGTANMYVNREARFYASVTYSGSYNLNKVAFPAKIGLYFTGNSGKNGGGNNFSRTGYLTRKNIHPNSNQATSVRVARPIIMLRLAEIYLNYSEALNEYAPGNADILKYINMIRERAGIPNLPSTLSQDQMRERIRNERRVELAFERHRWFDTRRWKIAATTDGGLFYGMNIDGGTSFTDVAFFKRTAFETRVFDAPKHYLFPIPQGDIDKNKNLVQNPGW